MTTPKERFLANKEFSKQHAAVVDNSMIEASLESALAEMIMNQAPATDSTKAAEAHFRLEGAKHFIKIWSKLSTPQPTPKVEPHGNLNRQ